MSRAGYTDEFEDPLELGRWRARVASATRGKRGQKLLRDMLAALDAMPEKRLVTDELVVAIDDARDAKIWSKITHRPVTEYVPDRPAEYRDGDVCALGALGLARGVDMTGLDPDNSDAVAAAFDIAAPLAREIVYMNDECYGTPERRWQQMRAWVASQIVETKS